MKVNCIFDDVDFVHRYDNYLIIANGITQHEVLVKILSMDGKEEVVTAVDGNELIKAIQNAMNT